MRILVLQLCRLGDILQTTPMLRGLRDAHPECEIAVLTHDRFGHVPVPAALHDRWVSVPIDELGAELEAAPAAWPEAVARVASLVDDLGPQPYDLTLNLSHSDLSGLLAALIPSREVRGGLVAADRTRVVRGDWMTYFWSSQTCRELGCFNLVDIHSWTAGVAAGRSGLEIDITEAARARMRAWLADRGLGERHLVAVQLGASDERKRWLPEAFAAAVSRVPQDLADVVLVGTDAERELGARVRERVSRPVHDALGATSIPELAALLERCALLITNDTGTMHVAAAAGTRVVDVSTGPVFVHETGPYGDDHLVIEPAIDCFPCAAGADCRHVSCREWIEPDDVTGLVVHALADGALPRPRRARILRGRFMPGGRLEYRTVFPAAPPSSERMRRSLARIWERTLLPRPSDCTLRPASASSPPVGPADHAPTAVAPLLRVASSPIEARELVRAADEVERVGAIAAGIAVATERERDAKASEIQRRLHALQVAAQITPALKPFLGYLNVRLDSTTETDVARLAAAYGKECVMTSERLRWLAEVVAGGTRMSDADAHDQEPDAAVMPRSA